VVIDTKEELQIGKKTKNKKFMKKNGQIIRENSDCVSTRKTHQFFNMQKMKASVCSSSRRRRNHQP
jgi:hypothetical protein